MKKGVKKNQIIIAALTLLLGVAGYINFSGNTLDLADNKDEMESAFAKTNIDEDVDYELLSEEDIKLNSDEEDVGEAVFTSADTINNSVVTSKLNREQVRSKAKEYYLEIINNDSLDADAIASATDAYVKLTEDMEKETEAETLLGVNGFSNSIVSISANAVDVIIQTESLSNEDKAKVEDIILRKTGCLIDQIVITTIDK